MFVLKQGWACLFGGLLLVAIISTKLTWKADWPLHRYDALFLLKRFAFYLNQIESKLGIPATRYAAVGVCSI